MNKLNHSACSLDALNIFGAVKHKCIANPEIAELLSTYSAKEDGGAQRPFNWHFFNNGNRIDNSFVIPGVRTSEKRTAELIAWLDESLKRYGRKKGVRYAKEIMEYSARLIHHVQDMSTPSHVVPVYHDPFLKDAYEGFCKTFASVQKTSLVQSLSRPAKEVVSIELTEGDFNTFKAKIEKENNSDTHILQTLYTSSANWTLAYLHENSFALRKDGVEADMAWTAFWEENTVNQSSSHQGFGNFGTLGNNFGNSSFHQNKNAYEVDRSQYLQLARDLYKRMVLGSLFVLEYIDGKTTILEETRTLIVAGEGD